MDRYNRKLRFLDKISTVDDSDCWTWGASTNTDGYGIFKIDGVVKRAHKVSYEFFIGFVPDGLEIDHLCRNRSCVNPLHLEPVIHYENTKRGDAGVNSRAKTHCPTGHPYRGENLRVGPNGHRYCRRCRQITYEKSKG